MDTVLDGLVSVTNLGNDEVKEDQHREEDDHDPAYPEDDVLSLTKLVGLKSSEIKVSKGESERGQEVSSDISNLGVLSFLWWSNDIEDHGEHHDENDEENDEDLEVNDDLKNHGHDETEALEDFHVEEGFDKAEDDGKDQDEDGLSLLWTFEDLEVAAIVSDGHVKDIQPVNANLNEFEKSNFEGLLTVDIQRMNKHDDNDSEVVLPVVIRKKIVIVRNIVLIVEGTIFVLHETSVVEIDVVDVEDEGDLLDQMGESSDAVESEREVLPFVLDQVHNDVSLEHWQLRRVCQGLHDLAIRFGHRWDDIELVLDLEWLH